MFRRKTGSRAGRGTAPMHFANRNAYLGMGDLICARSANGTATIRHLEHACSRLQDAADELESVLIDMPSLAGQADLHEAIGSIMETLRLVASAHARLDRPHSDMPTAAE